MNSFSKAGYGIALGLAVLAALHSAAGAEEWYSAYDKGLDAIKKGRYEDAVRLFDDAVSSRAKSRTNTKTYGMNFIDYLPYVYRASAYVALGDYDAAIRDVATSQGYNQISGAKRDKNAAAVLSDVQNTLDTHRLYLAAVAEMEKKDYEKAVSGFEAVLNRDPSHTQATQQISLAKSELDKVALEDTEESTPPPAVSTTTTPREDPQATAEAEKRARVTTLFQAAVRLFERGDLNGAESEFRQVLQLDASHAGATDYLQRVRVERTRIARARTDQRQQDTTAQISALMTDGKSLFDSGRTTEAKQKFAEVQTLDQSNSESASFLDRIEKIEDDTRNGFAAFFAGDYDLSIQVLSNASNVRRDKVTIYAFLACAYAGKYFLSGEENQKFLDNARSAFAQALRLDANYQLDTRYVSPKIAGVLAGN